MLLIGFMFLSSPSAFAEGTAYEHFLFKEIENPNTTTIYSATCQNIKSPSCTLITTTVTNEKSSTQCGIITNVELKEASAKFSKNGIWTVESQYAPCGTIDTYTFSSTGMVRIRNSAVKIEKKLADICKSSEPKVVQAKRVEKNQAEDIPIGKCTKFSVFMIN